MKKRLLFEYQLLSKLEAITTARQLLADALSYVINAEVTQQYILLCLSEAVTNIVKHNNSSTITIRFYQDRTEWILEIDDYGQYWDPISESESLELPALTEEAHGRGIALLKTLADECAYQTTNEHVNTLSLRWKMTKNNHKPVILFVEDDDAQYRLYNAYLSDDFMVLRAENGLKALEIIEVTDVNAIVSDIMMPDMDGMELREKLQSKQQALVIPFIFLTSSDHVSFREQSVHLGVDDYLLKPISKEVLIYSINRVIQRNQQIYTKLTDRIESKITASLAPGLPSNIHEWNVALGSRNTGLGGGDIVQHIINEGDATLILADIMGHDDTAKFFSYAYTGYLHGLLHGLGQSLSPNVILEKLSQHALQDRLFSCVTLTACVTQLKKDGVIEIACAAHPAPLHISTSGVKPLDIGGMLPGLIEDNSYTKISIQLKQGERIALYTDGLFEPNANDETQKLLENKISNLLMTTLDMDINSAVETIMTAFDELSPNYSDDVNLILLEAN